MNFTDRNTIKISYKVNSHDDYATNDRFSSCLFKNTIIRKVCIRKEVEDKQ